MNDYHSFLAAKVPAISPCGLSDIPILPAALKPFQRDIVTWALRRGRAAIFAGTGLGKTLQQLSWANAVADHASKPVLILTPLAVAQQTVGEAAKFNIAGAEYARSQSAAKSRIVVTNYERADKFDLSLFAGVVLDESSIIKSQDSKTRTALIDQCSGVHFRLCCTATPAPNDYVELGNHAEFLGVLSHPEMLATFFVHDGSGRATNMENYGAREGSDWRLKGHAEQEFWRWVSDWAVMVRHPRDLGYDEPGYDLPPMRRHQVTVSTVAPGQDGLFAAAVPLARTLQERLAARRSTIQLRAEAAAAIVNASPDRQWLIWCNLNDEASAVSKLIAGAVEVRGPDDPDVKAQRLASFAAGKTRILVSKPSIAGWGMNFQSCSDMVFVGMNDSFEQLYQAIRRCWRFGQTKPVNVHLVAADIEGAVVANLEAKEAAAERMGAAMAVHTKDLMRRSLADARPRTITLHDKPMSVPSWLTAA